MKLASSFLFLREFKYVPIAAIITYAKVFPLPVGASINILSPFS